MAEIKKNTEIWKAIAGYEGKYEVSDNGIIKSISRKWVKQTRFLKPLIDRNGYFYVELSNSNKGKFQYIHRIVALNFLKNPTSLLYVDHIDGDKKNNQVTNLKWCSASENAFNSYKRSNNRKKNSVVQNNFCKEVEFSVEELEVEKWKIIPEFNNYYVSNLGRVKSKKRQGSSGGLLQLCKDRKGYYVINVRNTIKKKLVKVHKLVAQCFLLINSIEMINHIDGNKLNNRLSNLERTTNIKNLKHASNLGLLATQPVIQYDLSGKFMNKFISISEAARKTNSKNSAISNCIHNKYKTHNNFIWKKN